MRQCGACGGTDRYISGTCVSCAKDRSRQWYRANNERVARARKAKRREQRARQYGMTLQQLSDMERAQDHRCAVCQKKVPLCIDHDHSCCSGSRSCGDCVRGLLCQWCNRRVGVYESDLGRKFMEYLEKHA